MGIVTEPSGTVKNWYRRPPGEALVELTSRVYANDLRFTFRHVTEHCQGVTQRKEIKDDMKNLREPVQAEASSKRGKISVYSEKSKRRYRFLLRNTRKIWSHEMEVGYPADFPMNGKKVKRDIKLLKESLEKEYPGIAWTWRLGFQKRKAPHVHFLTDRPIAYKWLARRWFEIVGSGDPRHLKAGTHVDRIKNVGQMINYMVTYMADDKETEVPEGFEDVGRFWGVKRGTVEYEEFKKIALYGVTSRSLRLFRRWAKAEYRSMGIKWKWQGLGFTALNGRRLFDALVKLVKQKNSDVDQAYLRED
jgi:hypothetical protein